VMPDLQRIKDLRSTLKSTERYAIGRESSFGLFVKNYEEMSKHWNKSLKVQARKLKLRECRPEAIADLENDYDEMKNKGNDEQKGEEGAHLEVASPQLFASWEEARDSIVEELSLNEKQRHLLTLIVEKFSKEKTEGMGKQTLLYFSREGETGKSCVIYGVKVLVEKMGRRNILQLAGASGSTADNIDGSTDHNCLGLEIRKLNITGKEKGARKVPGEARLKSLKRL